MHIWTPSAQTSERFMKVMICGEHVGNLGLRSCKGAAPGEGRLMRHPLWSTWPPSMQHNHPWGDSNCDPCVH